jgi:hypothetical protein
MSPQQSINDDRVRVIVREMTDEKPKMQTAMTNSGTNLSDELAEAMARATMAINASDPKELEHTNRFEKLKTYFARLEKATQ